MSPYFSLMLLDVTRLRAVHLVIQRYMPASVRENIELFAGASFWSMNDAMFREGPAMKAASKPMMNDAGLGLDGFGDRKEAHDRHLAGSL